MRRVDNFHRRKKKKIAHRSHRIFTLLVLYQSNRQTITKVNT